MVDVSHSFDAEVPVGFAFDYVSDIHNLAEWMYGLQRIAVVGDIERGPGAIYEGTVKLGTTLHTRIEVTGWEPGSMLTTESQAGFGNCSTWRFIPLGYAIAPRTPVGASVRLDVSGRHSVASCCTSSVVIPQSATSPRRPPCVTPAKSNLGWSFLVDFDRLRRAFERGCFQVIQTRLIGVVALVNVCDTIG